MDFDFAPGALPGSLELAYLGDSVYDLYVRAMAELENARRRSSEEVQKARKFGIEKFAENLLPVVDSLE